MSGWFTDVTCISHVLFFLVVVTVAFLNTVTGQLVQVSRRKENVTSPYLPKSLTSKPSVEQNKIRLRCGLYQQKLFCLITELCNKATTIVLLLSYFFYRTSFTIVLLLASYFFHTLFTSIIHITTSAQEMKILLGPDDVHCSQKCSKISSFELRNLQVLSSKTERIRKFSISKPLDTNLRINYYDVEMTGMSPAFCGNYSTFEMPTYSVKESKSKGFQFLHKLYFQSYRDVYTHSMCNSQCVFDCRQVGYDAEIMTELLLRNIPDLHVYQCDSVHSWVYILVMFIIFIILLMIIACCIRNKMSNIQGNTKETYV
ncbi:unnamed protein product [Onchocerca flexuosa]|uniref:Transmembrane protein 156 n=1 Tax=Onchocerca flexuosa TaxID=387005 RepID=A0A183HGB4_9BILA|nr:unnamed protein product [Onchocerca flexuosa]